MTVPESIRVELLELSVGTAAETHFDRLMDFVRPAIQCGVSRCDEVRGIGTSRMGGRPDVPDGWEWPHLSSEPLRFMAQLRLEDLGQFVGADLLPSEGLLSLFFAAHPFSASCREELDAVRVYHFFGSDLTPRDVPGQVGVSPAAWEISFAQIWSMPEDEFHYAAEGFYAGLSDEESEELREALIEIGDVGRPMQLLGYPSREQSGWLQLECERLARGLTWDDLSSPTAELRAAAAEWELLAQVSMSWQPMFEHDGYLHYWIRKADLGKGEFSRLCYTFERT